MIIRKNKVAGKVMAVLLVLTLLFAANCTVLSASADTLGKTLYVKTSQTTTPYLYYWVDGGSKNPSWPGVAMTSEGGDLYSVDIAYDIGELTGIIVNRDNGGSEGSKLTGDVKDITGNLFDVEAGAWSMNDPSSIKITSFGADLQGPQYVGSKITLSMAAEGGDGNLQYKIAVNGKALSDFSAKTSAAWEPAAAGDYTITFEVKDGAGETNSREVSYTILSVDDAEDPIFLSATPANGAQIKTKSAVTVDVKGAGGHVNNDILFYKTEIVDPNGEVVNTTYYQTGSKLTFTPDLMGEYTVNMYIQNNTDKNTTTMATYTYVSTDKVIEESDTDSEEIKQSDTDSEEIKQSDTDSEEIKESDTDSEEIKESDTDSEEKKESDTDIPEAEYGDIDGNGTVELKDAYTIQAGVLEKKTFTAEEIKKADVNHDGKITLKDASLIQQYKAGLYVIK